MAARKADARRKRPRAGSVAPLAKRLIGAFTRVTRELDELGARYAVIGGLAVGARVEPRTTRDIDFAVAVDDDAEAEALIFALSGHGYTISSLFQRKDGRIATVRTHGDARILIDYLFAATLIEREIVEASTPVTMHGVTVKVAQPWHLLAMKIKANRDHDSIDLHNLAARASDAEVQRAEAALRLMQKRGAERDRDLVADLHHWVESARKPDPRLVEVSGAALRRFKRRPR